MRVTRLDEIEALITELQKFSMHTGRISEIDEIIAHLRKELGYGDMFTVYPFLRRKTPKPFYNLGEIVVSDKIDVSDIYRIPGIKANDYMIQHTGELSVIMATNKNALRMAEYFRDEIQVPFYLPSYTALKYVIIQWAFNIVESGDIDDRLFNSGIYTELYYEGRLPISKRNSDISNVIQYVITATPGLLKRAISGIRDVEEHVIIDRPRIALEIGRETGEWIAPFRFATHRANMDQLLSRPETHKEVL